MAHPEKKLIIYHKLGKEGEARETSWKYHTLTLPDIQILPRDIDGEGHR
jgi:hypothetical protein